MRDKEETRVEVRGFGFGHVLLALLGGAAAGATAVYLTAPRSGTDSRRRLRTLADDTKESALRLPVAVARATEAAREAFNEALDEGAPHS